MEAQRLDQDKVGRDRRPVIEAGRIEGRSAEIKPAAVRRVEFREFHREQKQQRRDVQGPESAEARNDEFGDVVPSLKPVRVNVSDDKTAQDEEEVDEQIGAADEAGKLDMRVDGKMVQRDA